MEESKYNEDGFREQYGTEQREFEERIKLKILRILISLNKGISSCFRGLR